MTREQIYRSLMELAEKLDIRVTEENFKKSGIHVKSGFCKVKEQRMFIIDKHLKPREKLDILASFLATQPHEDLYVVPAVRDTLHRAGGGVEGQKAKNN